MKRRWIFLVLFVAWLPWLMAAWDNTEPADATAWNVAAGKIRANNDALEVVLGVDLGMEGSAYPWYQATAPTTKADASTAIDSTDNGFLWLDSDTRILYMYLDGTGFVGVDTVPSVVTFNSSDGTPTIALGNQFNTYTATQTITDFDNGIAGKIITIQSKGTITFDTTTAQDADNNLDGSSADIVTASGDVTVWLCGNGTQWLLISFNDASSDHSNDG